MKVWMSINNNEYKELVVHDKLKSNSMSGYEGFVALESPYKYPLSMTYLIAHWGLTKAILGLYQRANYLVELDIDPDDISDFHKAELLRERRWSLYNGSPLQVDVDEVKLSDVSCIYECKQLESGVQAVVPTQYYNQRKCPMMDCSVYFDAKDFLATMNDDGNVQTKSMDYLRELRDKHGMKAWCSDMSIREIQFAGNKDTVERLKKIHNTNEMTYEDTFYTIEELMNRAGGD